MEDDNTRRTGGQERRVICCLCEAGVEMQHVRKGSVGRVDYKHLLVTHRITMPTHCYSMYEVFAPTALFPLCTKRHKTSFITFARKLLPFLVIICILK